MPAVDPALAFVLSAMVGHLFGYEAALAIDALGPPAPRGPRGDRAGASADVRRRRRRARRVRAGDRRRTPSASSTACAPASYDGHLEASTAVRLVGAAARPRRRLAARGLPGRVRQGRHAERADRRPHRRAHAGDRGAHPAGRRHQAPGQDGHRRHLPQRRGRARPRRWCRPCSPPAPARDRAQLPHAQGARRPRPGGRRGASASPATASTATRRRRRSRSSTAAGISLRAAEPGRAQPRAASAPSAASPPSARCSWPGAAATAAR